MRVETAEPRRKTTARRLAGLAGAALLVAASPAVGQVAPPTPPAVAEALAGAADDPGAALDALDALLAAEPPPAVRRAAAAARPALLADLGRRDAAEAAYRRLLARGAPVAADLLALDGVALAVEVGGPVRPGERPAVVLRGERTGPVTLGLYRVDPRRLAAARAEAPDRSVADHLRAPPAPALSRLARWEVAALAAGDAPVVTRAPAPVAEGIYLLTATARGVTLPTPVLVHPLLTVARRGAGPGVLWTVDHATGAPAAGVAWTTLDAYDDPQEALEPTGPDGLTTFAGAAPQALGRLPSGALALVPLPPAGAVAAAPPPAWTDLPVHGPGQEVRLRLGGGGAPGARRLVARDPRGVDVHAADVAPRRGLIEHAFTLPEAASAGAWSVASGAAAPLRLDVRSAATPGLRLDLEAPATRVGSRLPLAVAATLASGRPLPGVAVAWRVRARPTGPLAPARGPLPPFALRADPDATPAVAAAGRTVLDDAGRAAWTVDLADLPDPALLTVEAALSAGALRAADRVAVARASSRLVGRVAPDQRFAAPGNVLPVRVRFAGLDGRPAAVLDVDVALVTAGVGPGAPPLHREAVRTDEAGAATAFVPLEAPGPVEVVARAVDADGRPAEARAEVFVVDPAAPRQAPRLLVDSGREGDPVRLLGLLPFDRGHALVTVERDGVEAAEVRPVAGGAVRWDPDLGGAGARLVLTAVRDGRAVSAEATCDLAPPGLAVAAEVHRYVGDARVALRVRVRGEDGRGRAARAAATVYPDATARLLWRGVADPGPLPPLAALDHAPLAATNGAGLGTLRVARPQEPGLFWVRVDAVDARGRTGSDWVQLPVLQPVEVRLAGPGHLVAGDRADASCRVALPGLGALLPGAVVHLAWEGEGLDVGRPVLTGARAVVRDDPGTDAVALEPDEELTVDLPLSARRPGAARLRVRVALEGSVAEPVTAELPLEVLPRGLEEARAWTFAVAPDETREVELALPPDGEHRTARLVVAADPTAATAALAGLAALADAPGPRARLEEHLARDALSDAVGRRQLAPPGFRAAVDPARWEAVLAALSAARDADGDWGPATTAVALALARARAAGRRVPAALLTGPLAAATGARGVLARALAGATGPLPPPTGPDERVFLLAAVAAADEGGPTDRGLLALAEDAGALRTVEATAQLLELLVARGLAPERQADLVDRLLLARRGPGWPDPADAGAAVRALAAVCAAAPERPGSRAVVRLEAEELLDAWSGAGLREWPGVARATGPGIGGRPRLEVAATGPDPSRVAVRLAAHARRRKAGPADRPPLERALYRGAPGSSLTPVGLRPVPVGARLTLVAELDPALPLAGSRLEVPLPAGCRLLALPPGFDRVPGGIAGEPTTRRLELDLLAATASEATLLPARLVPLRDPDAAVWSDEARLRVE